MLTNIRNFGFIVSMMESFPLCNSIEGQRPLAIFTDDVVKSSELVIKCGRTPVSFTRLLDFFGAVGNDELLVVRLIAALQRNAARDQIIILFDWNVDMRNIQLFMNHYSGAFSTVQFRVDSTKGDLFGQTNRMIIESDLNLGEYSYCHCDHLKASVPSLFYYPTALDKDGNWVSMECAASDKDLNLVLAYSKAFSRRFTFSSHHLYPLSRLERDVSIIMSDQEWDVSLDAVIDLTTAFIDTWVLSNMEHFADCR